MKIKKENGEIIEAHYINGKLVTLVPFVNNSAPCSNCALWNAYELKCTFPKDKTKECKIEEGTLRGWNTLEYVIPISSAKDEIISCEDDNS